MSISLQNAAYLQERKLIKAGKLKSGYNSYSYWKSNFNKSDMYFSESIQKLSNINKSHLIKLLTQENNFNINSLKIREIESTINDLLSNKYKDINLHNLKSKNQVYFYNFYQKFIQYAGYKLRKNKHISTNLLWKLLDNLLIKINQICYRTLILELNVARASNYLQGENSEERYNYYCEVYLTNDKYIKEIFIEYSVLTRLIIEKIENFINHVNEIFERYYFNKKNISKKYFKKIIWAI